MGTFMFESYFISFYFQNKIMSYLRICVLQSKNSRIIEYLISFRQLMRCINSTIWWYVVQRCEQHTESVHR